MSVGVDKYPGAAYPHPQERAGTSMMTNQNQDLVLSAHSAPAAAGPGWALSGHGLVSAGRPAGPCCQIPVPGTETQTETNSSCSCQPLWGE